MLLTTREGLLESDNDYGVCVYAYVDAGYRTPNMTCAVALWSGLTRIHVETLNIWSHLIGLGVMLVLCGAEEECDLKLYLAACCVTLLCSCAYHTFGSTSARNGKLLVMLDWQGVLVTVAASDWLIAHRQGADESFLPILVAAWTVSALSLTYQQRMLVRVLSCSTFACLGLLVWIWRAVCDGPGADWVAMREAIAPMYACYVVGAFMVCCAIPERRFNCSVLHSHVLMHVAVIGGMYSLWRGFKEQ